MFTLNHAQENTAVQLVRKVRALGIDVPEQVAAEAKLYQQIRREDEHVNRAMQAAALRLTNVPLAEFDSAKTEFITSAATAYVTTNGASAALADAVGRRLTSAVDRVIHQWEKSVVELFNATVAEFDLNGVADNLPNLGDKFNNSVLSFGQAEGAAVQAWKDATDRLRPIWDVYCSIAVWDGYDAPDNVTVDTQSLGLLTACRLGRPTSFNAAGGVAVWLVSVNSNTDNAKRWGQLATFIAPVKYGGYPLHLHTNAEAVAISASLRRPSAAA
ncbi:hypothetical protein [Mycolicibacter virginiensis]|uniref:hypothetical protein n=1 Tax=Mycolicibacter virginiensis TaxID=1795032 RepID=UPI00061B41CF|nr:MULTISPECIES: hypothetical protein [Mycobacteriaceae]ULP48922.1 hypothetical protein MJO54_07570 [Mycolicibacter virginiensis]